LTDFSSGLPLVGSPDTTDTAGGDPEAVVWEFLATYDLPNVAAFLRKLGASYHEAEECAQLALTACWEKRDTVQNMQAYLRTSARYIYLRRAPKVRGDRERHVELHEADRLAAYDASPAARAEARETVDTVLAAMEQLPYGQREALAMSASGMSFADIAQATGTSVGAVRTRICRGRAQLKTLLAPAQDPKETP
jgi:RNA polymerase sigma factor (sigma-70 family)